MEEIKKRNELAEYYMQEHKNFDFHKFLLNENLLLNNGAIILITPNQIIFTRNNPNEGSVPGSGGHADTYDTLNKIIYGLPLNNKIYKDNPEYLDYIREAGFQIKYCQNIEIDIINEGHGIIHMRAIRIVLPKTITKEQLSFLEYLQSEYGDLLNNISIMMRENFEDHLITFKTKDGKNLYVDNFIPVIEYAKDNLIDNEKKVITENNIFGITIDDIKTYNTG